MKRNAVVVAGVMMLAACASGTRPVDEQGSVVLPGSVIELQYVNYAWVPTYRGFEIDGDGHIYSWDRKGKDWKPADPEHPTAAELQEKYDGKTLLQTMGTVDVTQLFTLATSARNGTVTSPTGRCADAGAWVINAYLPQDGRLRKVLIRLEGDLVQQNTSAAAKDLAARIDKLELMERSSCRN